MNIVWRWILKFLFVEFTTFWWSLCKWDFYLLAKCFPKWVYAFPWKTLGNKILKFGFRVNQPVSVYPANLVYSCMCAEFACFVVHDLSSSFHVIDSPDVASYWNDLQLKTKLKQQTENPIILGKKFYPTLSLSGVRLMAGGQWGQIFTVPF